MALLVLEFSFCEVATEVTFIFVFPVRGTQMRHSAIKEKIFKESLLPWVLHCRTLISHTLHNRDKFLYTETGCCPDKNILPLMSFIHPVILTSESTMKRSKQHIKLNYPREKAQSTSSRRVSNLSFVRYQRLLIDLIKLLWTSDLCPWPEGMQLYNRGREIAGDKM